MNKYDEKWALIPSDPAVFDDMIQQYGIQDTKVQELFSIDFDEELQDPSSVYGLMFISRYVEEELPDNFDQIDPLSQNIVFTAQVVTNVCATLALLAVLLNANIDKGKVLSNFLRFTEGFSPVNRGLCLGSCKEIRDIHDAYATNANHAAEYAMNEAENILDSDNVEYIDSDDFHYITYIYKDGFVWELDGLKNQPVRLQACNEKGWLVAAKKFIKKRMDSTTENELTFNLMAVTKDSYRTMLAQKDTFDLCFELAEEIMSRKLKEYAIHRRRKKVFATIKDKDIPYYDIMTDLWKTLSRRDFTSARRKLNSLSKHVTKFCQHVDNLTAEKEQAKTGVIRQKWDYFPFLQQLFTHSFNHDVLLDPSSSKYYQRERVTKNLHTRNKIK